MKTLLIDNYDSFTYNLYQIIAELDGCLPTVLKNDDYVGWSDLEISQFGAVVVSPGPGRPELKNDLGISRLVLERTVRPLLGVCLGHQGLCYFSGGKISYAPEPAHGRISEIYHSRDGLFEGVPSPFNAVRYHSLIARDLPGTLEVNATTGDGLVMAVRCRAEPIFGVQFHPESIATEYGRDLLRNFQRISYEWRGIEVSPRMLWVRSCTMRSSVPLLNYEVHVQPVDEAPCAAVASTLFNQKDGFFWLDSSAVIKGFSRFSIMGYAHGPHGELVSYNVSEGEVVVRDPAGEERTRHRESLFDYLERETQRRSVADHGLPCEFSLGYVGYLGYELKADCGATAAHTSAIPDGYFLFCDRALVIDHVQDQAWLMALSTSVTRANAWRWLAEANRVLADLSRSATAADTTPENALPSQSMSTLNMRARHDADKYRQLVVDCQRKISEGETYEVCLTNILGVEGQFDDLRQVYRVLRATNPAPYSAYLALPGVTVLSSSPERFLTIDRIGNVESKPIKGTRRRGHTAAEDYALVEELRHAEKDRAENLMIVDLVRNDLGAVSEIGSVHVPRLFDVESYETVHQLVTTIRSRLRKDVSPVAAVRNAFPGGSMTGAPKRRTMEILDGLEEGPRGVYSGALGFFSLNGAVDLSIVIRTIVATSEGVEIGVGGAVVAQSDPDEELVETAIKAMAMLRVLGLDPAQILAPADAADVR